MASRILLLIAHGSRSAAWNHAIETFCSNIEQADQGESGIESVRCCYLEHAQPTIPSALEHACRDVERELIALPLFLSVGQHVLEDVPAEMESVATLVERRPGVSLFQCHASRIQLLDPLPTLDLLVENLTRRIQRSDLSMNGNGLVVVYYGAQKYMHQWNHLAFHVQSRLLERFPHTLINWGYGGDAVDFSPNSLVDILKQTAEHTPRILVLPALVAVGVVQNEIIPAAIELSGLRERIVYPGDAILPDSEMERTVLAYVHRQLAK